MTKLSKKVARLVKDKVTLPQVMHVALNHGVQPLQARVHPMWMLNGKDDATRAIRGNFYEGKSMKGMLSLLFIGKASDLPNHKVDSGHSETNHIAQVLCHNS